MSQSKAATVQDLVRVPGKAELVNGSIVHLPLTGFLPGYVAGQICASLHKYAKRTRQGYVVMSNAGFIVNLPNRKSFSPDAAFYMGKPTGMKFSEGAPVFAVEVRSENDYGNNPEQAILDKRADYFAAGTLVVWDVDILSDDIVRAYTKEQPESATVYRRGDDASAEPVLPGWTLLVDDLFPYYTELSEDTD